MRARGFCCSTFNIRRAVGTDGDRNLDRVAEAVRSLECDVVALQEVDSEVDADGFTDQLAYLASRTRMTAVAGPAFRRRYGGYGNALLTRLPVSSVRKHDLSVAAREPRGVLEVTLERDDRSIVCVTTHLGLREAERTHQVRRLLEIVESSGPAPLVLLGDFNAWWPGSRVCRALGRTLGPSRARRSYPSWLPLFALDRIWARPPARLTEVTAVRSRLTRRASDHLPVRARVEIDAHPAPSFR